MPDEIIQIRAADDSDEKTESAPSPEPAPVVGPEPPEVLTSDATFKIDVPLTRTDVVADINVIPARRFDFGVLNGVGVGPSRNGPASFGDLDDTPRTRLQAAPVYPYGARREGLGGEVFVEFVVDESGRVRDARAVRSSHPVFEDAALRAVARWVFEPGRRHGRIVSFRMAVPVVFNIGD